MSTFMEHIHRDDVPLFDADALKLWTPVEFDAERDSLADVYRHEDGSITYVMYDSESEHANPRTDDDCNIATLIQVNSRCIEVDTDVAGLAEAHDRWPGGRSRAAHFERYLAMFRPDILHFDEWSAGHGGSDDESYGWGYITRDAWQTYMLPAPPGENATPEQVEHFLNYVPTITPKEAFDSEVKLYGQWCNGEVFYAVNVHPDGTEESCGGYLGYDDRKDICGDLTASPVTETLY